VWDEQYREAVGTYGEDFAEDHRFQLPKNCHWTVVRETPANVGTALQNAVCDVEAANEKYLYGVFGDAQWSNKDRPPEALLEDLIEYFSALNLGNRHVASDVMGDTYEFLIKQFADASGHIAEEYYTNRTVAHLMAQVLQPQSGESVYDPTCGTWGCSSPHWRRSSAVAESIARSASTARNATI
jgi:type I restriction enzyme M protein